LPTYLGTSLGLHSILFSPVRPIRVGARAREGRGAQFIAFASGTENPGYATVKRAALPLQRAVCREPGAAMTAQQRSRKRAQQLQKKREVMNFWILKKT